MKELIEIKRNRLPKDVLFLINLLENVKYNGNYLNIYDNFDCTELFVVSCNDIEVKYHNISDCMGKYGEQFNRIVHEYIIKAIENSQFSNFRIVWVY